MQCLSIDLPVYDICTIHINASIIIYLSVYLLTYSSVFVYPKSLPTPDSIHPSFIHSFLLSIHTPSILDNHVLDEPPSKQPKKSCIDYAWIRGSIIKSSCLMCWPPRGFLEVLCQPTKGMDPQHPSTVNRISVNFSSALVLSLP